jgi:hypothetical protein
MIAFNPNPGARELRAFARIWFPLFATALGGVLWWRTGSIAAASWVWSVGAVLTAVMLASARVARAAFVALVLVTYPVGLVVSYVVLGAMFFLVFTPIGVLMRLAGRDPLGLRARARGSHWLPYDQDDRPERAFRQF